VLYTVNISLVMMLEGIVTSFAGDMMSCTEFEYCISEACFPLDQVRP
jgi:hypothetical protein